MDAMGFHEPYTLYPRKLKSGRVVYYYMPRDPETGRRLPGLSTERENEREARRHCERLLAEGKLIPEKKARPQASTPRRRRVPTLAEWADERRWWQWTDEGPKCEYCNGELERSSAEAPAIQRDHADQSLRILRKNILPIHGGRRLDHIEPADLESIMKAWRDEGRESKTINNRASVYRVMLAEAERLKIIAENPWRRVKAYYVQDNPKGILSRSEYVDLMRPDGIATTWADQYIYYAANLLASVTGFREGEILALKADDIHADHVTVAHSWDRKYGEGPQKTKRGKDEIPIPSMVYDIVKPLLTWGGYVFSFKNGARPCSGNRCNTALRDALARIGISDNERKRRQVSFHSWRAFANTYFRSYGVPDAKVQQITRHETQKMTEHYSDFHLEDFKEVSEAQASLAALLLAPPLSETGTA